MSGHEEEMQPSGLTCFSKESSGHRTFNAARVPQGTPIENVTSCSRPDGTRWDCLQEATVINEEKLPSLLCRDETRLHYYLEKRLDIVEENH